MSNSSRFTVAVHTLTLLASHNGEPLTSEYIASSVNTNPVVIRRLLSALRAANIVASQGGSRGGWRLLLSPHRITLRDVYRAVEEGEHLFALHPRDPNPDCPVGGHIQQSLHLRFDAAREALEQELKRNTIQDVLADVLAAAG